MQNFEPDKVLNFSEHQAKGQEKSFTLNMTKHAIAEVVSNERNGQVDRWMALRDHWLIYKKVQQSQLLYIHIYCHKYN